MGNGAAYKDSPCPSDQEGLLNQSSSYDTDLSASRVSDEEKPWAFLSSSRRFRFSKLGSFGSFLSEYWPLVTAALLVLVLGLQGLIWWEMREARLGSDSREQVGGDSQGKGPAFATEVVKWKADPEFVPLNASEFLSPKVQAKWETLYPAGAGFATPDFEVYNSTSVTHQLHCAYIMGKIFAAVLTHSPNIPEQDDYEAHFLHCVDYLRQAAMCSGDVAIEPRGENGKPGVVNLESAFNGLHVCKDYTQIKDYLTEQVKDGERNILPLDD